jgi:hypothetical protein
VGGSLTLVFKDGFAPQSGHTFYPISGGGTSQVTPQIRIANLSPGFTYSFSPVAGGYRLTTLSSGQFRPDVPGDLSGDGIVDATDFVCNYLGTRFIRVFTKRGALTLERRLQRRASWRLKFPNLPKVLVLFQLIVMLLGCRAQRSMRIVT